MKKQFIIMMVLFLSFGGKTFANLNAELTGVWGGSVESIGDYLTGAMTQYSPDLLEDNLLLTGLTILGEEDISDNGNVDKGAFMLLEFQTDVEASELHLNISMQSFGGGTSIGTFSGMAADRFFSPTYSAYSHDIQTISGFFDKSGNNFLRYGPGDYPTDKQWQTIDNIRLSDNKFQFLYGGHI